MPKYTDSINKEKWGEKVEAHSDMSNTVYNNTQGFGPWSTFYWITMTKSKVLYFSFKNVHGSQIFSTW